jgi:hypothetical protein
VTTNRLYALGVVVAVSSSAAPTPHASVAEPEPVRSAITRLVERHDCWAGDAPADMRGKFPGHVVVTRAGQARPTYGGARLVGLSLEQIFDGADHGLEVHAFCR